MDNNPVQGTEKAQAGKKRGRPRKVTKKALLAAIKGSGGLKGVIAKELGIPIRVLDGYLAIFPDAEKACRDECDAREAEFVAMAETVLYNALKRKEPWAVRFVSSRPDKGKGFIQRMETVEQEASKSTMSDHAPELKESILYKSEDAPSYEAEFLEECKRCGQEEREFILKHYKLEEHSHEPEGNPLIGDKD